MASKDYFLVSVLLEGLLLTIIDALLGGLLPIVISVCLWASLGMGLLSNKCVLLEELF